MKRITNKTTVLTGLAALLLPLSVRADELNAGDTAWMLTATALVLFMTIPGLSLFYAGMVRSKNVLSVLMQCFAITSMMTVLWVGWFGFNAGSELAADGTAGMAMAVTQIATASAALGWMICEWVNHGKPSVLGVASGAVGGLVAITPACGSVGPMGAIVIGFASGVGCFLAAVKLKRMLGYDDSPDVFGVHAIGGIIGALLTGMFCAETLGGAGFGVESGGIAAQVGVQFTGVIATVIYTGIASFIILKVVDLPVGLRVTSDEEQEGLDVVLHDERGYIIQSYNTAVITYGTSDLIRGSYDTGTYRQNQCL